MPIPISKLEEELIQTLRLVARHYEETGQTRAVPIPVSGGFVVDFEPRGMPYRYQPTASGVEKIKRPWMQPGDEEE